MAWSHCNPPSCFSLGSYASVASYMANLGQRFTREDQITRLVSFADSQTGLFGSADATLRSIVRTAQYELYWDTQYLSEIAAILDEKVKGEATRLSFGLSVIIITCCVLINTIFN